MPTDGNEQPVRKYDEHNKSSANDVRTPLASQPRMLIHTFRDIHPGHVVPYNPFETVTLETASLGPIYTKNGSSLTGVRTPTQPSTGRPVAAGFIERGTVTMQGSRLYATAWIDFICSTRRASPRDRPSRRPPFDQRQTEWTGSFSELPFIYIYIYIYIYNIIINIDGLDGDSSPRTRTRIGLESHSGHTRNRTRLKTRTIRRLHSDWLIVVIRAVRYRIEVCLYNQWV